MKKHGFIWILGVSVLCVFALLSAKSHAGVSGSKHDLSISGPNWKFDSEQVCVFCHTPHGANREVRQKTYIWNGSDQQFQNTGIGNIVYLWNRALANGGSGWGGYSTYKSSSLDSSTGKVRIHSLLCLSCHDGVGALNVLLTAPAGTANPVPLLNMGDPDQIGDLFPDIGGNYGPNIGDRVPAGDTTINLSNDHPVSIDYTSSHNDVVSGGLKDPASNLSPFIPSAAVRLFPNEDGQWASLECSSCHNPHQQGTLAAGTFPFLVVTIDESQLCRECHLK